jgi:hypothetical protein
MAVDLFQHLGDCLWPVIVQSHTSYLGIFQSVPIGFLLFEFDPSARASRKVAPPAMQRPADQTKVVWSVDEKNLRRIISERNLDQIETILGNLGSKAAT